MLKKIKTKETIKSILQSNNVTIQVDSHEWNAHPHANYWVEGITVFIPCKSQEDLSWHEGSGLWSELKHKILDRIIENLVTIKHLK